MIINNLLKKNSSITIMNHLSKTQRIISFITLCLTSRIILVLLAKYISKNLLFYMGLVLLIPAISFFYLYFNNLRLQAFESGGRTWWHNIRIIHGFLYLLFSILAIQKNKNAWIALLIDVIFGFIMFLNHHLRN